MSKVESIEDNSCVKAGCIKPSCCHDTDILLHPEEIGLFPHAVYDPWGIERQTESKGDNLYYTYPDSMDEGKRYIRGHIVGECENVRTTPGGVKFCGKYKTRPDACEAHNRGGLACNSARKLDGKEAVPEEFVEKPQKAS